MRILYSFILLILSSIGTFFISQEVGFAADDKCWFDFAGSCGYSDPPYCTDGKCTLSGGLSATQEAIDDNLTNKSISEFVKDIVMYFLGFVTLIAVLYVIYAGFQIMTGAGDEEKNKKAKNTITYIAIGIIVMWLAYSIVDFIIKSIDASASLDSGKKYTWSIIPTANAAAYTETDTDTFREYQNRLRIAIQDLESELKINKGVSVSSIQNIKSLVQGAYDRLPDFGDAGTQNDTMKRAVDRDLELAMKNPTSSSQVGTAISSVASFISSARIETIQGSINASPGEGNAPITVSFEATGIRDPSGATPDQMSYIWWMRENGGVRKELGRGKNLVYTFSQEGTYTVFLDVISGSRNSKKKIDVLPLSTSKTIDVKPRLGQIVLLVNGVNVSNIDNLKISPTIGKMGIIFDATASRATGGSITSSEWDFGNGNKITYNGGPIVERQIFSNNGDYTVKLSLKSNNGQTFTKELRLIVRNPSAVIQTDKIVGNVGDDMNFSSISYFSNTTNVEYSWQIQDDNNKKIINNLPGNSLRHKFDKIGTYIVTLNARSPNGEIDTDSKQITIESRAPVINLDTPQPTSTESPNTLVFDATKSYDPDTMSRKGLTYTWYLDGEKVSLNNESQDGAKGELTFNAVGNHTISLTIANAYGKVSTQEKGFDVRSILSANMLITPRVAPIGTNINFIAQSENADFFEWNMGDGSPVKTGNKKIIQHTYSKAGVYDVSLTVSTGKSGESNRIQRRIYVTNTGSPFALIGISNPSSTSYYDPDACGSGATVLNRSDITTFDASKSINIDGGNANLTYTWNYFGKVKTTPTLSEKLTEIGCYPIKLTVRSSTNGATHTSTEYIAIKNLPPEVTSLSTSVDTTKKDSQKVLVRVNANGATDADGVITSYIWYYTTESDKEPQNVQITQTPEITFVLPNITEKYYFGVILEDNDGAKTNSIEEGSEQVPLILDNQNGNIYMPLITLSIPKNSVLVGESVRMSVEAKTIVGTNITKSAEYAWDFDGDGRFDEKTNNPSVNYTYKNSGTYSVKVRATYNGVSNVKYATITIKNPLKANVSSYELPDGSIYLMNTTEGQFDTATWIIDGESIESRNSLLLSSNQVSSISGSILGILRTSLGGSDISTYTIDRKDLIKVSSTDPLNYQTSPKATDDTVHVRGLSDQLNISLIGNVADYYKIDTDTRIDSDLDGIPDNDIDNKNHSSYTDGSVFSIADFSETRVRERTIRLTITKDGVEKTKDITVIFDFIPDSSTVSGEDTLANLGESISTFDRQKLEELATMIRTTESTDRIILMQEYNILIENWSDPFSKAKSLIDIQEIVNTTSLSEDKKVEMTRIIDNLLVGDATSTDEITIASKLIQDLIPTSSPNRTTILEKLSEISSHPNDLETNRTLGKEILELVKNDTTIEDTYKIHIRNQLLIIINGGQSSVSEEETEEVAKDEGSGIFGFISGMIWVFFYIIGGIILVIGIGYIFYFVGRKNEDIGFQDFLIDSVFHSKKVDENAGIRTPDGNNIIINTPTAQPVTNTIQQNTTTDPLLTYTPPSVTTIPPIVPVDPLAQEVRTEVPTTVIETPEAAIPSWLQVPQVNTTPEITHTDIEDTNTSEQNTSIPTEEVIEPTKSVIDTVEVSDTVTVDKESLSNWLQVGSSDTENSETTNTQSESTETDNTIIPPADAALPDWLVDSIKSDTEVIETSISGESEGDNPSEKKKTVPKKRPRKDKADSTQQDTQATNTSSSDIPDWLK